MRPLKIAELRALTAAEAERLRAAGVESDVDLLDRACDRSGRTQLASQTGIAEDRLLAGINEIDLVNLPGVGREYARLLEAAGVDSCAELSRRDPRHLSELMSDLAAARATVRHVPPPGEVAQWIDQARDLAARIER
jgi:predicted flap endonuclease-1-like 5' DNA nuclease